MTTLAIVAVLAALEVTEHRHGLLSYLFCLERGTRPRGRPAA